MNQQDKVTKLLAGHDKFRDDYFERERHLFEALADGLHQPVAVMICCCDARVVPSLIVNADPGDLFVVRNIANLVPPFGGPQSNRSVGAAIEYAVHHLKAPHIIVCGHTQCGGLKALIEGKELPEMPTLNAWLQDAHDLRHRIEEFLGSHSQEELHRQLVYENVVLQLENLLSYPVVARGLEANTLELHGWVYNLLDGSLEVYNPTLNSFTKPALLGPAESASLEPRDSTATTIHFHNQSEEPVLLYCVTPQGVEEFHRELKPASSHRQSTLVAAQWRVRRKRDGAQLAAATATTAPQELTIQEKSFF